MNFTGRQRFRFEYIHARRTRSSERIRNPDLRAAFEEHLEMTIATYGTLATFAEIMGHQDAKDLLGRAVRVDVAAGIHDSQDSQGEMIVSIQLRYDVSAVRAGFRS